MNAQNQPLLIFACRNEKWKLARSLIEQGCDIHACDEHGITALQVCEEAPRPTYAHREIANLLRSYGARSIPQKTKQCMETEDDHPTTTIETKIMEAIAKGNQDVVLKKIMEMDIGKSHSTFIDSNGDNLLMRAYRAGMWQVAKELVRRGWIILDQE